MIRFFIILIFVFASLFRLSNVPFFSYYRDMSLYGRDDRNIYDWLVKKVRRRAATIKSKKYLKEKHNCFTLTNKLVTVIYNPINKVIYCRDKLNKKNISTYNFEKQQYFDNDILNEIYNDTFDVILASFNENANYKEITNFLNYYLHPEEKKRNKQQNEPSIIIANKNDEQHTEQQKAEMLTVEDFFANANSIKILGSEEKLDLNKATIEELNKLPGITIIIAKRIIKYREIHTEFKSLNEFYSEMKIKPHFQKQLNNLIFINSEKQEKTVTEEQIKPQTNNNERIVDI